LRNSQNKVFVKDYSLLSIVKLLHKWRKPIVYMTICIAILSGAISMIVPVYYESTTLFYAASEDLFKPKKVFGYSDNDIEYYGTTGDIQRILTVAYSHELTSHLVHTFGLYAHYKVDSTKSKAAFIVNEKLKNHYEIIRTKYDAIELTIEDRDPDIAAAMANSARDKVNSIISEMIRGSQQKVIESYIKTIANKDAALKTIQDSLSSAQLKYGIFDPDAQTEYLSTLITSTETKLVSENAKLNSYKNSSRRVAQDSVAKLTANIAGLQSQLDLLQGRDTSAHSNYSIERFNKAKGKILILDDSYKKATNTVNFDKELLKTLKSAYNLNVPALHIVETAQVPVVKSRPKRMLVVLASTFAALLFMVIGVLFIESYKHLDWTFLKEW
jgi:capsule polysaccharide export protein KpsE/RkpR